MVKLYDRARMLFCIRKVLSYLEYMGTCPRIVAIVTNGNSLWFTGERSLSKLGSTVKGRKFSRGPNYIKS